MDFKENSEKIWLENEEGKVVAYVEFPETVWQMLCILWWISRLGDRG